MWEWDANAEYKKNIFVCNIGNVVIVFVLFDEMFSHIFNLNLHWNWKVMYIEWELKWSLTILSYFCWCSQQFGLEAAYNTFILKFELCVAVKPRNCIIELPICIQCTWDAIACARHTPFRFSLTLSKSLVSLVKYMRMYVVMNELFMFQNICIAMSLYNFGYICFEW